LEKDNITLMAYLQQRFIQKIVSLTPKIFNRKLEFCFVCGVCINDEILQILKFVCVSPKLGSNCTDITINRDNGTVNKRQIKTRLMSM